jgi:hypothetical protein
MLNNHFGMAADLLSPGIEINSGIEANKAACNFTASVSSAYRLLTGMFTLSELNNNLPGVAHLLMYKKGLRKL